MVPRRFGICFRQLVSPSMQVKTPEVIIRYGFGLKWVYLIASQSTLWNTLVTAGVGFYSRPFIEKKSLLDSQNWWSWLTVPDIGLPGPVRNTLSVTSRVSASFVFLLTLGLRSLAVLKIRSRRPSPLYTFRNPLYTPPEIPLKSPWNVFDRLPPILLAGRYGRRLATQFTHKPLRPLKCW